MMVVTPRGVRFPDVVVTCDERDQAPHTVALRHPRLIVEVLSESTARTDRAAKVDEYRAMPSLEEIVLVDSRKRWSAAYHRAGAVWVASEPQTGGEVSLASVDMRLDLDGLYGRCGVPEIPREA
jgi:Uma2 family endonuclease